jgi:hypothetical protein
MLGSIALHQRSAERQMLAGRVRCSVRFPVALDAAAAGVALNAVAGVSERMELVWEVAVTSERVTHAMLVPESVRASVVAGLTSAIPALRLADTPEPEDGASRIALRVFVPTCVLATEHPEATLRSLAGLTLMPGERVVIRVATRPDQPQPLRTHEPMDSAAKEMERGWRQKTRASTVGFRVAGLGLVQAPSAGRAGVLAGHLASIFRSRRGSVSALRLTSERGGRSMNSLPRVKKSSGWVSALELLPLLMWPMGDSAIPGVATSARELTVPHDIPTRGRTLFTGRDVAGNERRVALSVAACKLHTIVAGASGSGKTTLLAQAALSEIAEGHAGVVIDPKGCDLTEAILRRVKPKDAPRVVTLDAGDSSRQVPGINVLRGGPPDLRTDALVATIKSIYPDWGIRSETWGRLAIRTLCEVPEATLADIGRLFSDDGYRRAAVSRLRGDAYLLSSWENYESLSPGAKAEVVQAPMARITALLARPQVRAVVASPDPRLDFARLFAERKFVLVSVGAGVLGEAGAALISSAVMSAVWSAIEGRAQTPPEKRHFISVMVDEFATVANGTPFGFELLAERARGFGAGLTVALQTLERIPEPTLSALLGNAASFLTFRAPAEQARQLARQVRPLTETDIANLPPYGVAARLGTGTGNAVAVVTGHTDPLPPETGLADEIRDRSAREYGASPQSHDDESEPLEQGDEDALGRTRRRT